ncbi:hypothetical protein [Amycolatopsis sp. NPDC006125]|uniref:hypothetical protein n=1 Tax=Amycolatopsis sp. NPDC006125 TaxID=3156730 RepID=UPI0033A0DEA5
MSNSVLTGYEVEITRRFECSTPQLFEELVDQLTTAFFADNETSLATYHPGQQTFTFHVVMPPLLDRAAAVEQAWRRVDGVMQGLRLPPGASHFGTGAIAVIPPPTTTPPAVPQETATEPPT